MTALLDSAAAEIEAHVGRHGWDVPTALYALVTAAQLHADDPTTAARLGLGEDTADALTPVEQDELPTTDLDDLLAQISWPDSVAGCAVCQHIVLLPPSAEAGLSPDSAGSVDVALSHPERREARLVVAVLRDGSSSAVLRLRAADGTSEDDLLTGPDLAPNLVAALLATFD